MKLLKDFVKQAQDGISLNGRTLRKPSQLSFSNSCLYELQGFTHSGRTWRLKISRSSPIYGVDVANNALKLSKEYNGSTTLRCSLYKRKRTTVSSDASADEMIEALSALPTVGDVDVSRFGPTTLGEYVWSITFQSFSGDHALCPEGPTCLDVHTSTATALNINCDGNFGPNAAFIKNEDKIVKILPK